LLAGAAVGAFVLATSVAAAAIFRPDRAIRVATGFVAATACANIFVSGFDPQTVFAETTDRASIRRLRWGLGYHLDRTGKTVDVSVAGLFGSRAAFHDGFGCVLMHGPNEPYLLKSDIDALKTPKSPPLLPEIAGAAIVEPSDPKLKAALDHAFEEPAAPPFRRTWAVVVVHDGAVIAERYADGIGVDTPLLGFSMTKSVVNALIGLLTQQGRISPSLPAPIPEWHGAADPRREIEVEHLLRMTTGLALDETNSGFDVSSQMVYLHDDMAGFAVKAAMIAPPGTRWAYSSPTTQLLARIIRDITGGPEQTLAFAWRELFWGCAT
jgi:beta-lactamase family protein